MQDLTIRSIVKIPLGAADVDADFITFHGLPDSAEHVAIRVGVPGADTPLVRIHSECLTGDVFASRRCDCGDQLAEALSRFGQDGGYLLYLRQEGRGIGLYAKLEAYVLQSKGADTFEANRMLSLPDDARDFSCAAAMLRTLGVGKCRLLTNNPDKVTALQMHGIDTVAQCTGVFINDNNRRYIEAKVRKKNHAMVIGDDAEVRDEA
ncbi:GTP cyclohydrolase II RibA [Pinirhizobacter soli]|uniref:GTP cyclohydrolase II RibA n=1 Tax=Pinirhizobacter soli TaxID=2786953 RepID=UPI002029E553|nr:GTP cyclohydrolase II RibA [Pinirhizobacter soli]